MGIGLHFLLASLPSSAPLALVRANPAFIERFCPRYPKAPRLFESHGQGSFTVFHDEDLQPVILNSIPLSAVQQFELLSDPLKKYSATAQNG
jgi:hypothetical protein